MGGGYCTSLVNLAFAPPPQHVLALHTVSAWVLEATMHWGGEKAEFTRLVTVHGGHELYYMYVQPTAW